VHAQVLATAGHVALYDFNQESSCWVSLPGSRRSLPVDTETVLVKGRARG